MCTTAQTIGCNGISLQHLPSTLGSTLTRNMSINVATKPVAPVSIPDTKPTGQKRSLERGKATHKKNPGKRAKSGG